MLFPRRLLALIAALAASGCRSGDVERTETSPGDASPSGSTAAEEPALPELVPAPTAAAAASGEREDEEDVPHGRLAYDVRDAADGSRIPCKLSFVGVPPTRNPLLARGDVPRREGLAVSAYSRVMSLSGHGAVRVPHGTYDIHVTRGPEWDQAISKGVAIGPKGASLRVTLRHVVDTRGWLSADFHVHAAASFDSHVPMEARVFEFVSDGVEMIVSTDHNVISDYAPVIAELGAEGYLASATGDEITTASWGHFGSFPLPLDPGSAGQGAVHTRRRTPAAILGDVRKDAPEALIDVHHPRFDRRMGYFNAGKLDAAADRAGRKGFSFDFDAVEILNGYQDGDRKDVDLLLADWFELLQHGHRVAATGNSDTHHLDFNLGGYPRNYVRLEDDRPASVRPAEIARTVKDLHAFFTTGPFVSLSVGAAGMGDLAPAPGGHATADISVQAAPWVSVDRVVVYLDGKEVQRWSVPASTAVVRFEGKVELTLSHDGFVVVRVEGDAPLAPVVGGAGPLEVLPFAVTNPVFLDEDANGRYDPPLAH